MINVESGASALASANGMRKRLIVEGWRFLPHSYAIVNQWQLLALLRRNIALKVVDVPFYRPSWQTQAGLLEPAAEQALRSIEVAQPAESADVTMRVFYPFTFSPSRSRLTAVFATLEQQLIRKNHVSDLREYEQLRRRPPPANVKAVTPSQWSAEGFYRAGFDRDQVLVVPHGVDTATFHPMSWPERNVRSSPDRNVRGRSRWLGKDVRESAVGRSMRWAAMAWRSHHLPRRTPPANRTGTNAELSTTTEVYRYRPCPLNP